MMNERWKLNDKEWSAEEWILVGLVIFGVCVGVVFYIESFPA